MHRARHESSNLARSRVAIREALLMRRGPSNFRRRYGAALNRARTIERQAAGLREALARLASGEETSPKRRARSAGCGISLSWRNAWPKSWSSASSPRRRWKRGKQNGGLLGGPRSFNSHDHLSLLSSHGTRTLTVRLPDSHHLPVPTGAGISSSVRSLAALAVAAVEASLAAIHQHQRLRIALVAQRGAGREHRGVGGG
jgi:hypothetical protein